MTSLVVSSYLLYFHIACSLDFEDGIGGWEKTGTVFNNQPTFGDNPFSPQPRTARQSTGGLEDRGYENRSSQATPAGEQGDSLPPASVSLNKPSHFSLAGLQCEPWFAQSSLSTTRKETSYCNETMNRKSWDVKDLIGQHARVRLIDNSSGRWGHINFDDLKGDIICE
ncbi:hypothetical protein OS493_019222 [Desmophyllum pertusum]|uniref:Uncharacterized protein n=1 Tax=Desmophyllum pertusum TaxID=174260 RepID=A0A9X0CGF0_9CNID|nr:hypothetical protein OS493_019222 [Desmophyllum pertusum]